MNVSANCRIGMLGAAVLQTRFLHAPRLTLAPPRHVKALPSH